MINEWNGLVTEATGEELLQKQRDLAYQTVNRLGGGPELEMLLEFLKTKGAGDLRKEILDQGLDGIFTGELAERSRQWLLSIKDAKLKEQLMLKAGAAFEGSGFVEYFQQVGASPNGHNNQYRLLTGYCSTLAKTDPEAAMKKYAELAYPLRIDNAGFPEIVANFPSETDFLKFATTVIGEDTKVHGRSARTSLLRNWAGVKPEEAAQYVLANSKTTSVNPVQMEVVMQTWAQNSPEAAQKWLGALSPSLAKDHGTIAMANFYQKTEPATAFTYATSVGDYEKKVATSTTIFKEWAKTDKKAAEAAWLKAFPQ